jgi:hypothetical protein
MPNTDNHGYNVPNAGDEDWHIPLNENFERYDTDIEIRDTRSNLLNYTPKAGAKFLATDTEEVFLGDGSSWSQLSTSGGTPTFAALNTNNQFLGIGRNSRVTGSEFFGVHAPVGDGAYGGMYVDTASSAGWPFYGYATDGSSQAWTYYRTDADQWRVNNSGDHLVVDNDGKVGIGTGSPGRNKLSVDARNEGSYGVGATWSGNSLGAAMLAVNDGDSGDGIQVLGGSGRSAVYANAESADRAIEAEGDVFVDGTLEASSKNFVQSVDTDDGEREVVYTSVESDRAHTETSGVAELEDGRAEIDLPEHFAWVTDAEEPLMAQVTAHARQPVQPQVTERSTHRIVIEDFSDGSGRYEVSYTVKGTREGYADQEVVREPDPDDR